jgi:hypothetical protein
MAIKNDPPAPVSERNDYATSSWREKPARAGFVVCVA